MQLTYFVQGKLTGLIRIGTSVSLEGMFIRYREIQKINCDYLELIGYGRRIECVDHSIFSVCRGQWYFPTEELLAYIEAIKARPVTVPEKRVDYDVSKKVWEKFGHKPSVPKTASRKQPAVQLIRPFKEVEFGNPKERVG